MQCVHLLLVVFYLHFSLEISLIKKNEGLRWPELIIGDTNGELIMDTEMSECLMHLTSEEMVRSFRLGLNLAYMIVSVQQNKSD